MKNFDLEAAKRGAAVCTRGGCKARIVCSNVDSPLFSIVAMVRDSASGKETPQSYRDDGGWLPANTKCSQDLMMRDDDYLEKLERGGYQSGQIRPLYENPSNSMPLNLTRREWFAGMAMQGIFAGRNWRSGEMIPDCIGFARNAVELADALIEELEKTEKK